MKAKCPDLAENLDTVQFDTAVNMGAGRAVRFMQAATDCVPVDGKWGPITAAKIAACDPGVTLERYCNAREAFYHRLATKKPKMKVFLKGRMNRLNSLRGYVGLKGFESIGGEKIDFGDAEFMMRLDDDFIQGVDEF